MQKKSFLIIFISIIFCAICSAQGDNRIDINNGKIDPIPIAINDFKVISPESEKTANAIIDVIKNDLNWSGTFRTISSAAFIEQKTGINHRPVFAAWQQINSMLLLNAVVIENSSGRMKINLVLWDTILEKEILKQKMEFNTNNWRKAAHQISNSIYKQITGLPGYFNTKIVYISENGSVLKRKTRIAMMDYDGHNHQYLTDGHDLVLTPRFSPDGTKILYLSYKNNIPQVFIMELGSRKSKLIGDFPGMSFAPRFSPDGQYVVMSISKKGYTHIYEMNLKNKKMIQLTDGPHLNTSPSYSPDGSEIVFNSDRNGARQLFVMSREGGNLRRISYGGGAYAEPLWSKQNFITFTKMSRSAGFSIGIMLPELNQDQSNERIIASGYLVESPSWSGNGQMIVFARGAKAHKNQQRGLTRLYAINFAGYNERIIPTPYDASQPDWLNIIE